MCKFFAGIGFKLCIITVFTKIKKTTDFKTNFPLLFCGQHFSWARDN